jgi:DNA-binding transcriptional regulator PaaX
MATKYRKFLLRDVGYDANLRESQWQGIMARDLLSAVKKALEMKTAPSFVEPIAQYASVYAVYVRCGISEYSKVGCVEIY